MNCIKCGNPIPPKRLEILPYTKTCVNCSTDSKLIGVPIAIGKGDDIYTDLNIMTQESYKHYNKLQKNTFMGNEEGGG